MPNITIHGKRTETIYPFTVRYKGETITGRYIRIKEVDEDESLPLNDFRIEFDDESTGRLEEYHFVNNHIEQAIEDYEKIHN